MKKIFLTLIVGILLLSLVAAAEINELPPVKQFECTQIKQTCATCTFVNVSVAFPNNSIALTNQNMTNAGGSLWTLEFCNTAQLGKYDVMGSGDLDGSNTGFDVLFFEVTPDGFQNTLGFYFIILILSLGVILIGYYAQDATVIVLGSFGLVLVGLFVLFNGIDGMKDGVYTWGLGLILLGLGGYFGVRGTNESLQ